VPLSDRRLIAESAGVAASDGPSSGEVGKVRSDWEKVRHRQPRPQYLIPDWCSKNQIEPVIPLPVCLVAMPATVDQRSVIRASQP
jgi:hypothetical protein